MADIQQVFNEQSFGWTQVFTYSACFKASQLMMMTTQERPLTYTAPVSDRFRSLWELGFFFVEIYRKTATEELGIHLNCGQSCPQDPNG